MSTNMAVLSPNTPTTSPIQPPSAANVTLSESDVSTLRRVLRVIKVARAEAKSQDQQVAREASLRLAQVLFYLAGFLDAKHVITGLDPGFQSVFQSSLEATIDPEKQLDNLQKSLADALEAGSTRLIPLIIIGIGLALTVAGVYLKATAGD